MKDSNPAGPRVPPPGLSSGLACGLLVSLALTLAAWIIPDLLGVNLLLAENRQIVIWTVRAQLFAMAGLFFWAVACGFVWLGTRRTSVPGGTDAVLAPLLFLPLSLLGFFTRPLVSQALAANLLFFVPVFLISLSLYRLAQALEKTGDRPRRPARGTLLVGLGFWAFYAFAGWYFTISLTRNPGDTGHYITLAESLYFDHDLDLRNNFGDVAERKPHRWHINPLSRERHLYSLHPIGLPLLLAPFVPGGVPARQLVLGLLSGLCCAGIWELCRLFGARRLWSAVVLLLFALSAYWGMYSLLCLPEVAGAALTTWGVVAILRQKSNPRGTRWVCAACCAYLPWLHERFFPISLAIVGLYLLTGFANGRPWRPTIIRLGPVLLAYGASLAGLIAVRLMLFTAVSPVPVGKFFFSFPLGTWFAVAHSRGLLAVLPLFAAMIGAAVWILFHDPPNRMGAATALLLTGVVLVTSSATPLWFGGASIPGRYLVAVTPLFVPSLARVLERVSPVARWWVIFLGLIPCFQFLLKLAGPPETGLLSLTLTYTHLNGLMEAISSSSSRVLHPFAILLIGGTSLLFFLNPGRRRLASLLPAMMILVAAAVGDHTFHSKLLAARERVNAGRLADLGPRLEQARVRTRGQPTAPDFFFVSDRFSNNKLSSVSSRELASAGSNDWAGRGYRWAPLGPPFGDGAGWRACRLTGRLEGQAAAYWSVREGSRTLLEEPLAVDSSGAVEVTAKFRCTGNGKISIAVRFAEGEGTLLAPVVSWTPFSENLLAKTGLRLADR